MQIVKIILSFILLACCFFYSANAQKFNWINFDWEGDTISGKYFNKVIITVPIQLDNLPYRFNAQLDLGAVESMLYANSITPYLSLGKKMINKIDTTVEIWIQSQKNPVIKNVLVSLDSVSFGKRDLALFLNFGDTLTADSVNTPTSKHVGTIAPDLFQDKILILDYPNHRLCVVSKLPREIEKSYSFTSITRDDGRIKIPFMINGKKRMILFDTGSSIFSLYTTEKNLAELTPVSSPIYDSLQISAWGNFYYAYGKKTESQISVGGKTLAPPTAYFDRRGEMETFFETENIWGITGNAYFLNNTVIIDYKKNRIGIK